MILGIDEVGRGPWAGPLVIGAAVLGDPLNPLWQELNDSKKLSPKKRENLSEVVLKNAKATGLGWVSAEEIDALGLSRSLQLATYRAVAELLNSGPRAGSLRQNNAKNSVNSVQINNVYDFNAFIKSFLEEKLPFTEIIIDGTVNFLKDTPLGKKVSILPKADSKIKEVSAASIIAKVARDNYMKELSKKYPEYGFEKHVGYGTKKHKDALLDYGPCSEHRFSFAPVKKVAGLESDAETQRRGKMPQNTLNSGQKAEEIVAEYLERQGHKILARNHKTRFYEIDIVSATKEHIYFTEVKYRKNSEHGKPLDFVDKKKQKQISFAAEAFMKLLSKKLDRTLDDLPSPILAAAAVSGEDFKLDEWVELE